VQWWIQKFGIGGGRVRSEIWGGAVPLSPKETGKFMQK